jgi:hypothetical protein
MNESISMLQAELFKMKQAPPINEDEIVMRVLQKVPLQSSTQINKTELISEILSKIPASSGGVVYQVAPLEKLKKDFLEETKKKILTDIEGLSDNAKRLLKYLEVRNQGVKSLELEEKCFLMSHSGASQKKVSDASVELRAIHVADKDTAGWHRGKLKNRIIELLVNFGVTEQDVAQVYNHILMEMLK